MLFSIVFHYGIIKSVHYGECLSLLHKAQVIKKRHRWRFQGNKYFFSLSAWGKQVNDETKKLYGKMLWMGAICSESLVAFRQSHQTKMTLIAWPCRLAAFWWSLTDPLMRLRIHHVTSPISCCLVHSIRVIQMYGTFYVSFYQIIYLYCFSECP